MKNKKALAAVFILASMTLTGGSLAACAAETSSASSAGDDTSSVTQKVGSDKKESGGGTSGKSIRAKKQKRPMTPRTPLLLTVQKSAERNRKTLTAIQLPTVPRSAKRRAPPTSREVRQEIQVIQAAHKKIVLQSQHQAAPKRAARQVSRQVPRQAVSNNTDSGSFIIVRSGNLFK